MRSIEGIPTELNRLLREGSIDVSPSSSIEYAMNPGRYRLLPGLSITSRKEVMSIILQSRVPIEGLDGKTVALTTASATSVVLLRIILELRYGVRPDYTHFDQGVDRTLSERPMPCCSSATWRSRRAQLPTIRILYDLGELWHQLTGLPFVFALWQVNYRKNIDQDLARAL